MKETDAHSGVAKLSDEELSKELGRYQTKESIGILLGVLCIIVSCVLAIVKHDILLFAVPFFIGVGLILLLALPAQKKKRALMHNNLDDFFNAELERTFGPAPETPLLPIDKAYLESAGLVLCQWKDCTVGSFREGVHEGLRFSAANVELSRMVEEKSGPENENWTTRTETVFKGIVIRCKDICEPDMDITLNDWLQKLPEGELTDPAVFSRRFTAHTADGKAADALVTPAMRVLCRDMEKAGAGRLYGISVRDGALALALETKYVFADIPDALDMRDVAGMRKWYTATLVGMGRLLDMLRSSAALSGAAPMR